MDYGRLVTRSFDIVLRNRALWIFGILLALTTGGGGGSGSFGGGNSGGGSSAQATDFSASNAVASNPQAVAVLAGAVTFVVIILVALVIVVRLASRAALIGLVADLETAQVAPTVRRGFARASESFSSVLGIALLVNGPLALVSLLLLLVAGLPLLAALIPVMGAAQNSALGPDRVPWAIMIGAAGSLGLLCCVAILLTVVSLVIQPLYEFFLRAAVIGRRGAREGIREGYRLARANLGSTVIVFIIKVAIGIAFGILMIPLALILIGFPVAAGFVVGGIAQSFTPGLVAGLILGIPGVLILIFVSGLYRAFESTFWTQAFLGLSASAAPASPATLSATAPVAS